MKIILSGGGTLGPVTPLLAIFDIYKNKYPATEFIWIGTKNGPEKKLIDSAGIKFIPITSGKLRRYFSFKNFVDIFKIISAFFSCLKILRKEKPNLLITAGGFVSVPLHFAAYCLKIPCWVHQQDNLAGLANKIMTKTAKLTTVALEDSLKYFNKTKTRWIGNPVREVEVNNLEEAKNFFNIFDEKPIILALGGGTGSQRVNEIIHKTLNYLPKDWHIIHLTGLTRDKKCSNEAKDKFNNYKPFDFLEKEIFFAYNIADIVISRGGFSTLTELANLSKTAVVIPISNSHQEENVRPLVEKEAVIKIDENEKQAEIILSDILIDLNQNKDNAQKIGDNLHLALPVAKPEIIYKIMDELTLG